MVMQLLGVDCVFQPELGFRLLWCSDPSRLRELNDQGYLDLFSTAGAQCEVDFFLAEQHQPG